MRTAFVLLGAIVVGAVLASSIGSHRWNRTTARLVDELVRSAHRTGPGRVDFRAFAGLPEPVGRYLRHVLRDGQPLIRVARFRQEGELRTDSQSDRWSPFEARQVVVPGSTGFVWDAQVKIFHLLHVRVRDAYTGGQGSGRVSLLSAIPVAADSGRRELDSGALHRYLAEAVWYPTALLPSAALTWTPIDEKKALATFTAAGLTVSLEFWFNGTGEVTGIYSAGRWGRFSGEYRQAPWEGHCRNYQERDGMLVPSEGEVGWYSSGEWQSVWRGRITESSYAPLSVPGPES